MIAIIGGGISGLAAAYELALRRVPFRLFEASSRVGGLVHTEHVDGYTIEAGADSMLAQKPAALALCSELGLTDRLIATRQPRTAFVLHRGRLHRLPSPGIFGIPATWRGLATYSLFTPAERLRLAAEGVLPMRDPSGDESVADFFARRFGRAAVTRLAQPLIGGIHAGDIATLSMPAVVPRLAQAARTGSLLRWVRRSAPAQDADGAFRSFATGMHELVAALRSRLAADALRPGEPVTSIAHDRDGWTVAADSSSRFAAVVMACPAHVAARLLERIDQQVADDCAAVPYVSTVSVALGWPRSSIAHPLQGSGFVVARASNATRITACTWVSSKWEGRAPQGHALLRAYLGGAHDPSAVDLDDDTILRTTVSELSAILGISGPPSLARIYRWRRAGAQHEVGHLARVRRLEARVAAIPGLFMTGSGLRAIGVPDCIADGRAAGAHAGAFLDAK